MKYTDHIKTRARRGEKTPQSEKILGTNQEKNNAGGFSFVVDKWSQLHRFLILGSEGGTYYVGEAKLTKENATNVLACIKADGKRVVNEVVKISQGGRAPRNDAALFVLALAASMGDAETKSYAFKEMPKVARIGTHLFAFASNIRALRGWSKAVSKAFNRWYNDKSPRELAHQVTKYQQRNGWSHRDIFRLSHIKTNDEEKSLIYRWIIKGNEGGGLPETVPQVEGLRKIWAFERAKRAGSEAEVIRLVEEFKLPWECIPTNLRTPKVWEAMLPSLGMTALIRNLGSLSSNGVLKKGGWDNLQLVQERLTNREALKKARIHPLNVLVAINTYGRGRGVKGKKTWEVIPDIMDSLDEAFYASFENVEPANKRFLLGVDVSGSMGGPELAGMTGITPRIGAAALAMTIYRTERKSLAMGFSHDFVDLGLSKKDSLGAVIKKMSGIPFGATNCALPMVYAAERGIEIDTFVVLTDNETWYDGKPGGGYWGRRGNSAGKTGHPVQALQRYRDKTGIPARLVVLAMTPTKFSIADPKDPGMLDIVGFDTATPKIVRDFSAGLL